jgi:integrase
MRELVTAAAFGPQTICGRSKRVNSSNLLHRSFKPLLKSCGVPQIRFHDLRHTCATIRFIKGQHPKRVSDILGHSSVAITLDIYSHVIPGMGGDDPMEDALS